MSNTYKINIYFKGKEKPLILTDDITKEHPYMDTIEYFKDVMHGDNKIITLDFANDYAIFNAKNVDYVTVSKPHLDDKDDITLIDGDKSDTSKEIIIDADESANEEVAEDDEVFNNDSDDITVVED